MPFLHYKFRVGGGAVELKPQLRGVNHCWAESNPSWGPCSGVYETQACSGDYEVEPKRHVMEAMRQKLVMDAMSQDRVGEVM